MFDLLRIMGQVIAGVLYATAFVVAVALGLYLITPAGWIFVPFVVVLYAAVTARLRRRRAAAVLGYLEGATRLNLPLAPMVQSAALSESGRLQSRLTDLAGHLEAGKSVALSLADSVPEVPPRTWSLIDAAERIGRLPRVLARLVSIARLAGQRESAQAGMIWGYPVAIIAVMLMVIMFVTILILPKFVEIFEDFGVAMPANTLVLFDVGMWIVGGGFFWILLGAALLVVAAILMQFPIGRVMFGPVLWYLPVIGGVERDRGLADACHLLEQSLCVAEPLPDALDEAANLRTNPVLRRKLRNWAGRVDAGEDIGQAARAAGLPTLLAGMLGSGQAAANLPEAVTFLRKYYDERFGRSAALLQAAVTPAVVLILAVVVGWILVGLFYPLVVLIEAVIPQGWVVL